MLDLISSPEWTYPATCVASTAVALATSLLGEVDVVRRWGFIGSQGQSRRGWYEGSEPAEAARQTSLAQKRQRGQIPMAGPCSGMSDPSTKNEEPRSPLVLHCRNFMPSPLQMLV